MAEPPHKIIIGVVKENFAYCFGIYPGGFHPLDKLAVARYAL
jgi:hypothetical protein